MEDTRRQRRQGEQAATAWAAEEQARVAGQATEAGAGGEEAAGGVDDQRSR